MVPVRLVTAAFVGLVLGMAALTVPCRGQTDKGQDMRLSPEIRDYSTPEEGKIESTGRIGERRMAAWGVPTFNADSSEVINELRMTVFDGSRPLFDPVILHSPQARPYGTVNVIPVAGHHFLLLWSDRRKENPGLYIRRFDTGGVPLDEERRIDIPTAGFRNDTTGRPRSSILTFSTFPGWSFVQIDSLPPFIIRSSGAIDTRPVAISHLHSAYYLAKDTSVVTVSEKAIRFFGTLWDAEPRALLELPYLDSALVNSEIITREADGRYVLIFAVVSDPFSKACRYWKITFDDTGYSEPVFLWKDPVPVFRTNSRYPPDQSKPYKCYGAERIRRCDNTYNLIVRNLGWHDIEIRGTNYPVKADSIIFQIVVDPAQQILRNQPPWQMLPAEFCADTSVLRFIRKQDSSKLSLSMILQNDTVDFSFTAAFRRLSIPRISPALFRDAGEIGVLWQYNGNALSPQAMVWQITDLPSTIYTPPAFGKPSQHSQAQIEGKLPDISPKFLYPVDKAIAVVSYIRYDTMFLESSPYGARQAVGTTYFEIQAITAKGWRKLYTGYGESHSSYFEGQSCAPPVIFLRHYGYDPASQLLCMDIANSRTCYDPMETEDKSRLLAYSFIQRRSWDSSGIVFPDFSTSTRRRLSENEWLTFSPAGIGTQEWMFRIHDRDGNELKSVALQFEGNPSTVSVAQNYTDRSLAILWGSSTGAKGTFLSYTLDILADNVQISRTTDSISGTTGCYRNDTLFVVWEDYRHSGIPNIYGIPFIAPKASGVKEETAADAAQRMRARFSPGSESITVEFAVPTAVPVEIELFDLFGNRADRIAAEAGTRTTRFETGRLTSGTYFVRARTADSRCYHAISHVSR